MIQYLLAAFTGLVANLTLKIEIRGMDNIPRSGALIVTANHIGWVDPPLLRWAIGRRVRYMAKIELFTWTISGLAVRLFDAFPVRRGGRDRVALRRALRLLASGEVLGMFPGGDSQQGLEVGQGSSWDRNGRPQKRSSDSAGGYRRDESDVEVAGYDPAKSARDLQRR